MINKIILFVLIVLIYALYYKYNIDIKTNKYNDDFYIVNKHLLNKNKIDKTKPILWILINHELNSRSWVTFNSRLNNNLNQPYLNITIESIIKYCGDSFNICILDDQSIKTFIPNWNIDIDRIPEPIKYKLIELAKANILKKYGGMFIPPSFICFRNLINVYNTLTNNNKMFVGEFINKSYSSDQTEYIPCNKIIGSNKNNEILNNYIKYLEYMISTDYTSESIFKGNENMWLRNNVKEGNINLFKNNLIGTKKLNGDMVTIEDLFSNNYLEFDPNFYGVYIPNNEILKRTNYNWFSRLSREQSVNADNLLGTLLKISCSDGIM